MDKDQRINELEAQVRQLQSDLLRTRLTGEFRATGLDANHAGLAANILLSERGEKDVELLPELNPQWVQQV